MPGLFQSISVYLVCSLPVLTAQETAIRVQTRLVQVPVSVTAKDGRSVEGLHAVDFRVLDDGIEREITADVFDSGAARISLVVAIQSSAVPAEALATIHRIGGMFQPLVIGRRGEAAVVTFDREIRWLQDFTRDPRDIQRAVRNLKNGSPLESHLLDAIAEAAERMRGREGRKVLLVISESYDRGSETSLDDAIDAVQHAGIEIFAAHYAPNAPVRGTKRKDPDAVRLMTEATGGWDYPFLKERSIEKAIENLGVEVHSQYILSFPQRSDPEGLHQISVEVPGRSDLHIRSRQAYWTDSTGSR